MRSPNNANTREQLVLLCASNGHLGSPRGLPAPPLTRQNGSQGPFLGFSPQFYLLSRWIEAEGIHDGVAIANA